MIPEALVDREVADVDADELVVTVTMRERKQGMEDRADAFIALPGGIGTLEEFFEVLSWRTLGLHNKPIVIVDEGGYWESLAALLRSVVEGGFADRTHLDHVAFISDLKDLLPTLAAMPRNGTVEKQLDRI